MLFSGIEILFYMLGVISTLIAVGIYVWNMKSRFNWTAWILLILGSFLMVFSIAWSVSSVLEGEPRAASMGLVVFGIPGLILIALGRNVVARLNK